MPRLSVNAQLERIRKQKALLEKKERELQSKSESKDLKKIVALIKKAGLTAEDVVQALKATAPKNRAAKKTARKKVEAKYRNPADPSQTWTGRGRSPAWIKQLVDTGRLEEAVIN